MQKNYITQKEYSGANQDSLNHVKVARGYKSNEWLTFVQARKINRSVIKGERGVGLVRVLEVEDAKGRKETKVKGFTVFNLDQTKII